MGLVICADEKVLALKVADIIEAKVRADPRLVMALATGHAPACVYRELIRRHTQDLSLSFRFATAFNTDEFLDLWPEDPRSTRYFMNRHLFTQIDIKRENTFSPLGKAVDREAECTAYENLITARGGLGLAVLGLGHNGHVGFNEPGSSAKSRTRVVEFTESTLAALSDGQRFTNLEETPPGAMTLGMGTLMEAKSLVLVATGIGKAQTLMRMYANRPGPSVPASLLLVHPDLTVVVDQEAATALRKLEIASDDA